MDVADFDGATGGIDIEIARDADRLAALAVDDGKKYRVIAEAGGLDPTAVVVDGGEGAVGQVGPTAAFPVQRDRGVEIFAMARDVQWLYAAVGAL